MMMMMMMKVYVVDKRNYDDDVTVVTAMRNREFGLAVLKPVHTTRVHGPRQHSP